MEEQVFKKFSSKISDVYIELHDFIFRHGTYENHTEYFVGRNEIRRRLRAILMHTDTDSGTYLLAGRRGVGKTSLINKVFQELSRTRTYTSFKRFFLLFGWMLGIVLVENFLVEVYKLKSYQLIWQCGLSLSLFLLCTYYIIKLTLYRKRKKYINNKKHQTRLLYTLSTYLFYALKEYLILGRDKSQESVLIRICKYVGVISLINVVSLFASLYLEGTSPFERSRIYFLLLYGVLLWLTGNTRYFYRFFTGLKEEENKESTERFRRGLDTKYSYFHAYRIAFFFALLSNIPWGIFLFVFLFFFSALRKWYWILGLLLVILFVICRLCLFIPQRRSKTGVTSFRSAFKIFASMMEKHYFLKKHSENKKYVCIKINLGYDNLKNIDVLRLVAHNIYVEYERYCKRGVHFWVRQVVMIASCIAISSFLSKSIFWSSSEQIKQEIEYLFPVKPSQENTRVLNMAHKRDTLALQLVDGSYAVASNKNSLVSRGIFCVRQFFARVNYGLSWMCVTFINTLLDRYEKPTGEQLSGCFFWGVSVTWWLLFFSTYLLYVFFSRILHTGPLYVLRQLHDLEESIAAQIKKEEGLPLTNVITGDKGRFWHIGKRREKNYPMADAHEIEKRLGHIMNSGKMPRFIIVFDELDKIEMPVESLPEESIRTDSFSPGSIRRRQQAIFKLLSGLKYFLSTAKAKFIFVAGKEMYEASLADVADRNYYLGSIFNDVIYVPGFMSDSKEGSVTRQTERFVCHYLFPENYIPQEYSLEEYNKYLTAMERLEREEWGIKGQKKKMTSEEIELRKERQEYKRKKIIFLLNNFILYLTHVGKGAPKKIVSLFEECVYRVQGYDIKKNPKYEEESVFVKYLVNSKYFLKFDFFKQYTINMVTYLVNPVLLRFSTAPDINRYGDRLLVSGLFFLDHLYKFHQYSFSWRALECSPELIDVNKSAALRDYIADILHYLSQNHLKEIDNGLYDFRFFKKTANEINFLSRVSEKASAMFDFTLDETYNVIHYYEQKIKTLQKQGQDRTDFEVVPRGTLASFYFTLGELHLYCDEVEDAILEFNKALVLLKAGRECMEFEQVITLFKVMLCLGVTYERKNLNDQAFLVYTEIGRLLVECRHVEVEPLGLKIVGGKQITLADCSVAAKRKEPGIYIPSPEKSQELVDLLQNASNLHPDIQEVLNKFTVFETLKLLHLPLLAKFQILEKIQAGGIQERNIRRLVREFNFLTFQISSVSKNLMIAEFYNKVGDILFYKNSFLLQENNLVEDLSFTKKGCGFCSVNSKREGKARRPCDACCFYRFALASLLGRDDEEPVFYGKQILKGISRRKDEESKRGDSKAYFNLLATLLSNIGDVMYSCTEKEGQGKNAIEFLWKYREKKMEKSPGQSTVKILEGCFEDEYSRNYLECILSFYILAEYYYTKSSLFNMGSHQSSKILMVLKDLLKESKIEEREKIKDLADYFAENSLRRLSNSFKDITFKEWETLHRIFNENSFVYKNLPLNSDAFEPVLQYYFIELWNTVLLEDLDIKTDKIEESYKKLFGWMRYEQSYGILNRINLLHLKTQYNKVLLQLCMVSKRKKILNTDIHALLAYLISDSIQAIQEILNYSQVYGENYLLSNIFITNMFMEQLFWVRLKERIEGDRKMEKEQLSDLVKLLDNVEIKKGGLLQILGNKEIRDKIRGILKELDAKQLDLPPVSGMIRESALRSFHKTQEMHAEGRTYKDLIERACFLNDEFNDRKFHFLMACEIYKINTERQDIQKRLTDIECTIVAGKPDSLFKPANFFEKGEK